MSDYIVISVDDLLQYGVMTAFLCYIMVLVMELVWLILLDKLVWPKFFRPLQEFLKKHIIR